MTQGLSWLSVWAALLLPSLAAILWLRVFWPEPTPGRWPLILGYGYVLGLIGVTLLLQLQAFLLGSLAFAPSALVLTLLVMIAIRVIRHQSPVAPSHRDAIPASFWTRLAFGMLALWLAVRFIGLALEVWWQPLFPWDAWTTWAARARVWSELRALVPFVSPQDWLSDTSGNAYTVDAWNYPATVSLIAAWPALALGSWNETAANLPWLGCALALALGFYGQARLWGVSALTALVFMWLLMSMPLLNTHIALAGYADLWMATALGFAFMAFLQWTRSEDRRQLGLALALILCSALIKQEGVMWALLFIPAWTAARLRGGWLLVLPGLLLGFGLLLWTTGGVSVDLPGLGQIWLGLERIELPYLGRFDLAYHGVWAPVLKHFFLYDNWHLLGYLTVLAVLWTLPRATRQDTQPWERAGIVWALASLIGLYILFFWTDAYLWAVQGTSINRVFMHFMPALVFWMMTVWVATRQTSAANASTARPAGAKPTAPGQTEN
ncbi:hypothetical protein [Thiocapsa rosea]|uniref:Dolichyl-phosphate-mannose-protein mannosyltransferase n=1 Tax=Thiocapsa rosea TaxID=69360 RepID=A0A495V777_9GAMM|nr:hypothetical protein [Thiocapsa rosea]RKT44473.1 hypothetical protein BDD21_1857 [Thiocapsa rosea]